MVTLKCMLTQMLRGRKTTLSYDGLCTFLTQAAKVVNDRPVAQENSTTDDSEYEKVNGLLGRPPSRRLLARRMTVQTMTNPKKH